MCNVWVSALSGVCVYHLNRCKTSYRPTKTPPRDPCKRTCGTPVVHLGAIISRSWWPPESHIFIYIFFSFLLLGFTGLSLHVRCIPHQQFDKTFLSKCVYVCVLVGKAFIFSFGLFGFQTCSVLGIQLPFCPKTWLTSLVCTDLNSEDAVHHIGVYIYIYREKEREREREREIETYRERFRGSEV